MADDEQELVLELRGEIANIRGAIEQALKLHPETEYLVDAIALRMEADMGYRPDGSPEQWEQNDVPFLTLELANLQERARALIERHPDVEGLFEAEATARYNPMRAQQAQDGPVMRWWTQQADDDPVVHGMQGYNMPRALREAVFGTIQPLGPNVATGPEAGTAPTFVTDGAQVGVTQAGAGRGMSGSWGRAHGTLVAVPPEQSAAPIRVEERNGKIARISDRDSPLRATEEDFNKWREPVLDHVQELLSGDFRVGTNHGRIRDRLVALGDLLAGNLTEVKERQFRIGYEIERLDGLIVAYRTSADDMPALNAAVLEDLDRLRIALAMGINKLERWAEFRRAATDDPMQEGSADPVVISNALNNMAVEMERQQKYFDPELPDTFRFLAEAARDPQGATKTVIYGAVKSAENVVSFLGQRALGIGINAAGAIEQHISKVVARALLVGLSAAALEVSGALPKAWAWLQPLLKSLAKMRGG